MKTYILLGYLIFYSILGLSIYYGVQKVNTSIIKAINSHIIDY